MSRSRRHRGLKPTGSPPGTVLLPGIRVSAETAALLAKLPHPTIYSAAQAVLEAWAHPESYAAAAKGPR